MFLAYVSPLGCALVDKRLYLPESWTSDKDRCEAAGVPEDRQGYRSKTELALEMVGRAQERGHLKAGWVAADDAFGMSPSFSEGLASLGMWYVLDVPAGFTVWPPEPERTSPAYQGRGAPRKPRLRDGQCRTMEQRSDELLRVAWREIAVAEGSQGLRSYLFSAQRVRPTTRRKPGGIHWAVYRRNPTAASPATTCPMHRKIPSWKPWHTWEAPAGVLRPSSRQRKATWGWTSTRHALGRAGITTWACACWAELFCWACNRLEGSRRLPACR